MTILLNQDDLDTFCKSAEGADALFVDTEFVRDRTYYPRLCLIQLAIQGQDAVALDPIVSDLDWSPLYDLFENKNIVKVFHAGRQDLEILYNLTETIPYPIFDTQIAAMVCGYGESVAYNTLCQDICGVTIDKKNQFMDWAHRPLKPDQLQYALNDVIYLQKIYVDLKDRMESSDRMKWVNEEMENLIDESNYKIDPYETWNRLKLRSNKPHSLEAARQIAAWREIEAQNRNVPRSRIIKDEIIMQVSNLLPKSKKEFSKIRSFPDHDKNLKNQLMELVDIARNTPNSACPRLPQKNFLSSDDKPTFEMLKMLLKIQSAEFYVASKMIASNDDLETITLDDEANVAAMKGWRYEIFGQYVRSLKKGELALCLKDGKLQKQKL